MGNSKVCKLRRHGIAVVVVLKQLMAALTVPPQSLFWNLESEQEGLAGEGRAAERK